MVLASISRALALALGAEGLLAGIVGLWAWFAGLPSAGGFLLLTTGALFVSGGTLLATRSRGRSLTRKTALLSAAAIWGALSIGGLVPFWVAGADPYAALFDSVSAVTTTGYWSIQVGGADPALVLWRAVLQWIGGLTTLLLAAIVFLPAGLGGAAFATPGLGSGISSLVPSVFRGVTVAYASLTVICVFLLFASGTSAFDGVLYALSAIATGGDPKGYPSSIPGAGTHLILGIFMLIGALWFPGTLNQPRVFLAAMTRNRETLLLAALVVGGISFAWLAVPNMGLVDGFFVTASMISTSGIVTEARDASITPLLALAVIGGSVAGASGGLRLRRAWLLGAVIWNELNRGVQPHEVRTLRYGGQTAEPGLVSALFAFAVLWFSACAGLAVLLSVTGVTAEDAILAAVAALTNTGPGMSTLVGAVTVPGGSTGTTVLMAGMLLGRLEVIALVAVLSPWFWTR